MLKNTVLACLFIFSALHASEFKYHAIQSFGGTWTDHEQHPKLTLKVNPTLKLIDVDLNEHAENQDLPDSIKITFYDKKGKATTLELKTIDTDSTTKLKQTSYHGNYMNNTSLQAQSFVGFEISILFGKGSTKQLKSSELQKAK